MIGVSLIGIPQPGSPSDAANRTQNSRANGAYSGSLAKHSGELLLRSYFRAEDLPTIERRS